MAVPTTSAPAGVRFRGPARTTATDGRSDHQEWLSLVSVQGPFLSLPVLRRTWPQLDALDKQLARELRLAHRSWHEDREAGHTAWTDFVLRDLLGWGDALHDDPDMLAAYSLTIPDRETTLTPSFVVLGPGADPEALRADAPARASATSLLGLVCPPDARPTSRIPGSAWAASPADRLAVLCRHHKVELGLVAAGRWWTLVWAPRDKATATVTFDSADWGTAAERPVVRAFLSLLHRRRFFSVPDDEVLPRLLEASKDEGEEIASSLGAQVQRAVELLIAAIGRADLADRDAGGRGLAGVGADEIYQAALATQMRVLFALFAEERGLLPADNPVYAQAYSAGRLCADLEGRARDTSEEDLEHSTAAWHRLVALFHAIYEGVDHPGLRINGYDGSLFDPSAYPWLEGGDAGSPLPIDDRTVLHMLRSVQYVTTKVGRTHEARRTAFRTLSIAQIGSVYEGLLSYDGRRADEVMVGLIGKAGHQLHVPLSELEEQAVACIRRGTSDTTALAKALAVAYKSSGVGTPNALARALAPPSPNGQATARRKLLAATGGDAGLTERLLPFVGIIRRDLRDLPVVVQSGGLYLGQSSKRKSTGSHYTPEALAKEVAERALAPLVHFPGPLETADGNQWHTKSSREILALKVADIACGSGAFLVAACRYLAEKLVEARALEGDEEARGRIRKEIDEDVIAPHRAWSVAEAAGPEAGPDLVMIRARREVAEHCLYGVDINPLAVELAKFSLWLDTVEPGMPFTFLDDRLVAGDALLGVHSYEQIESMHVIPAEGRRLHAASPVDFTATVPFVTGFGADVREAVELREKILGIPGETLSALTAKRRLLNQAREAVALRRRLAELVISATVYHARRGKRGRADASQAASDVSRLLGSASPSGSALGDFEDRADDRLRQWKRAAFLGDDTGWKFLHWALEFPEVFQAGGGFDAIVGNPPFLGGQKLVDALGPSYREYLVNVLGREKRGSADLVAYFLLRAHELLNGHGQTGLIATNTLAQGDTREVGLDQLVAGGVTIRESVKSERWPTRSAALEYCAVWTSRAEVAEGGLWLTDGAPVRPTSSLDPVSRVTGTPQRLAENRGIAFQGSIVLGLGFTMEPEAAQALIAEDARYREVLFPYLNGQDLNSRPDASASRWVVDFRDWSEERAKAYPEAYQQVVREVRPERLKVKFSKTARERWWQYERRRPELYELTAELDRVLVIALVSKVVMPVMVKTGQVFSHMLGVFASDDPALLALLSSASHYWWTISRASTLEQRIRYTPSDVFETFPRPELTQVLRASGHRLDAFRRDLMLARNAGVTATYNLVHNPNCQDADINELRAIHEGIDAEVARAYGWHDLLTRPGGLGHGFHDTRQGIRYTVGPAVRRKILDRLLELNLARHAVEESRRSVVVQPEL